jgi:SAM-dependent methyltransferase
MKSDNVEERLRREGEFHDHAFAEDVRASADRFYSVAHRGYERYRALVRENAAGAHVLEYGCGPGSEAFELAAAGATVHGIDISPVAIDMAKRTAVERGVDGRCRFDVMNAEALTFPAASFDRICGSGILHHLDLARGFAEIARTLKPGGRAIFVEPLGHNPAINWYRRRTPKMRTADEHPLLARDLAEARKHFARVRPEFHSLSVLAAVPLLRWRYFDAARALLQKLDDVILSPRSPLRWGAWLVVLILET